jgi:glycosyltransferase involved in cell wall biosynthesis
MNGAVLVSGDFVRTGGMDMPNFALAAHLADCGVSVQLVAYRVADALLKRPNVHWRKVPKPFNSYFLAAPLLDRAGRQLGRQSLARGERVIVNGGNCQVGDVNWVHYVHAAYQPAIPTMPAIFRRTKARLSHQLNLAQEASALRSARLIIANSERTRRDLTERLGLDNARIRTVYYGIDADRFRPPEEPRRRLLREQFNWPDRPQVAFIGALGDRRKGFDTLFEAWTHLCRDASWDCDLVVVGQGAELNAWQARARAEGLNERVRFLGFRQDVPEILAACDALVAPTRYESFGLGVQEALCTGLPALVSADAGVAERYPASFSELLLQDASSSSALEWSLKNWRRHRERFSVETRQLSSTLRQRTWQTMAQEIHSLIA